MTFNELLSSLNDGYSLINDDLGIISKIPYPKESVFVQRCPKDINEKHLQKVTIANMDNYYVHTLQGVNHLVSDLTLFSNTNHWRILTSKELSCTN